MNAMSLKYLFASIHCYNVGLTTTKLAILILYRRVFVVKGMLRASVVLMVVVVLYGLSTIISGIFYCIPVHAYWDKDVEVWLTSMCNDWTYSNTSTGRQMCE